MDALLRLAALVDRLRAAADETGNDGVCPMSAASPPVGGVAEAPRRAAGEGGAPARGLGDAGRGERERDR
ncbi:hypothetical protein [Frankia sp. KB5]|uniref:hypothetical protein n=1 Tax=Frankia sp. KB5 TaxID=683318 RepID=UPI000A11C19D|nr:hypothetical protein [Frankia sp. KB5]ORT46618.1 hypothetical protein KBI5_24230 [Frankia sp. KB5]